MNKVHCHKCGGLMTTYTDDALAHYCKKCGIRAVITFGKTPVVKLIENE